MTGVWNFGPRRWVVEALVDETEAVAPCPAEWAERIDGHQARQPRSVSARWLAEARALRSDD